MKILGIETSCDETAAAILEFKNGSFRIAESVVASSVEWQAKYGGIVPEVAARKQVEFMMPVLEQILNQEIKKSRNQEIKNYGIDYIAVTNGPGLITSLRVGVEAARTLSYVWGKPLIAVNHLEGHVYSALLSVKQNKNQKSKIKNQNYGKLLTIKFPAMALVVSGGHTELVLMKDYSNYKIIGQTVDDAVGEAFDKVAKILDLGYPGGPIISKMALEGDKTKYNFPRPMMQSGDFNFSFSGLKTAVLYETRKQENKKTRKQMADMCASFQESCVEVLVNKTIRAAEKYKVKTILLGGGVAANGELRERLTAAVKENLQAELLIPELKYTGDNATMIALAGYFRTIKTLNHKNIKSRGWKNVKVDPNLRLK